MTFPRLTIVAALGSLLLGGCVHHGGEGRVQPIQAYVGHSLNRIAVLPIPAVEQLERLARPQPEAPHWLQQSSVAQTSTLRGRVLTVASAADIQLRNGEVILTFDDGPRSGRTDAILDTLDEFAVKATFLMTGASAEAHPRTAQAVALRGHSIGTHTYDHGNLAQLTYDEAQIEIGRGRDAVTRVLAAVGEAPEPFFRFPYLAHTSLLRTSLTDQNLIELGVDIDSSDYLRSTPSEVINRTLARLRQRGRGIILFHDIHQRTVDMLPALLQALALEGYKVVSLRAADEGIFGRDIIAERGAASGF